MNDEHAPNHYRTRMFRLGQLIATPAAIAALQAADTDPADLLQRHVTGDWGDIDAEDRDENARAVVRGSRILSAYKLAATQATIWVITEADRSVTTLLLPEDY